jgi:hypothetical protein
LQTIYTLKIPITDRELKLLTVLAKGRHFLKNKEKPNRANYIWGNSNEQRDLLGVLGEYAVSKFLKIPMDMSCGLEGDGGTDFIFGNLNIQIKTTKYKTGRLVFNNHKEIDSDIFILCYVNRDATEVCILGYIKKESTESCIKEMDLGRGIRLVVEQKHLLPITDLLNYDKSL